MDLAEGGLTEMEAYGRVWSDHLARSPDVKVSPKRRTTNGSESVVRRSAPKRGITAAELRTKSFPPVKWVVRGYVAEGLTILAGKPKLGKSWLMLDFAVAVARGGTALGTRECAKGAVLYAALEDTPRRLRDRLEKVHGPSREPWPQSLTFWTFGEMDRLDAGGLNQLREWVDANPDAELIIVDTFAKVRSGSQGKETAYETDYREVGLLKALADEAGLAIILVTHTRKMAADDPFDTVSGTLGITGAADTTLIMSRDGTGVVTLNATGRDVAESEMALEFDKVDYAWRELGEASGVRRSDERGLILDALFESEEPMTSRDIADATGQKDGNVRRLLLKMAKSGDIKKVRRGLYVHSEKVGNNGNSGNEQNADDED